jgi:hypothetical protein
MSFRPIESWLLPTFLAILAAVGLGLLRSELQAPGTRVWHRKKKQKSLKSVSEKNGLRKSRLISEKPWLPDEKSIDRPTGKREPCSHVLIRLLRLRWRCSLDTENPVSRRRARCHYS